MVKSNDTQTESHSQFGLLASKRFAPFFWTQFAGAFNDNLYKNVLILIIAFQAGFSNAGESDMLINISAGLFILPFFLFSAIAGQISDKYEKSKLIRMIKLMEIVIMVCGAAAFYTGNIYLLMLLLFFMGTQSAFFGPVKYSIIPQHLDDKEIIGGNALVEMGTFVAILLGTIAGGVIVTYGTSAAAVAVVLTAVAGWIASRYIPTATPANASLKLNWNIFTQSVRTMRYAKQDRTVFLSILGISWFWFLGACYLTQIPNYAKNVLCGSESVATLLLAMFSVGIGGGSLLCEWLSGKRVEYGLVPIGSIGLSLFGLDLVWAYETPDTGVILGLLEFLKAPGGIRVLVDLVFIGVFGGLYIVPLFALVQTKSDPEYRSRVIAANNIVNALLMVCAALYGAVILGKVGLSIPAFFGTLIAMNVIVAIYIYTLVPEFTMRCMVWVLTHLIYRIKHKNLDFIPESGPAVIVCNHVSYVDALVIASLCRRPARFVTAKEVFNIPILKFIFKTARAIPISSPKKDPVMYERAFASIKEALDNDEIVCIFPEGMLTKDGNIGEFKPGIEKIIETSPVPVIPSALKGLWGSYFSHKGGPALTTFPRRFFSTIYYEVGPPIAPMDVSCELLYEKVSQLRGEDK